MLAPVKSPSRAQEGYTVRTDRDIILAAWLISRSKLAKSVTLDRSNLVELIAYHKDTKHPGPERARAAAGHEPGFASGFVGFGALKK